jgi:hypothetical protein
VALQRYARHVAAYTSCFLVFAAPVLFIDWLLIETNKLPVAVARVGAAMPVRVTALLQDLSQFSPVCHLVTVYFLSSLAATVVVVALSESFHERPIGIRRCVRASWARVPSMIGLSLFQALAVGLCAFLAVTALGLAIEVLDSPQLGAPAALAILAIALVDIAALWLALISICLVVALSATQIVLQRRGVLYAIGRAFKIVMGRRHRWSVARDGWLLSICSFVLLGIAAGLFFGPVHFIPAAYVRLGYSVAVIVVSTLFWPPVTVLYTVYAVSLLARAQHLAVALAEGSAAAGTRAG